MSRADAERARSAAVWRRVYRAGGMCLLLALTAGYARATEPTLTVSQATDSPVPQRIEGKGPSERSPAGAFLAAIQARADGDYARAADYYEIALSASPDNLALAGNLMRVTLADGRHEAATSLARKLVQVAADDPLPALVLAAELVRAGDHERALPLIENLASRGSAALLGLLVKAWINAGLGDADRASAALEVLSKSAASQGFAAFHGALIADYLGRFDAAEIGYAKSMELTQGASLRVVEAQTAFLRRRGRTDEAIAVYENYLKRDPDNPLINAELTAARRGDPAAAFVESPAAGLAEACFNLAGELAREGAVEEAAIFARLAIRLRPDFAVARTVLASIYESLERWEAAIAIYRGIDTDSPYGWNARMRIAGDLDRLDRVGAAREILETMAAERPARTDALIALGDMLRARGSWDDAVAAYDRAFQRIATISERDWALFYTRGIALERSGRWVRAEGDFLQALEFRPDQPFVLNYLGYSWIEQGTHYDKALDMLRKAASLRPRDGYIADSLGWVYYRLGQYAEAVRWLERAAELVPDDPVINDHLGDAYWRVDRRLEARFQWRRALSFEPAAEEIATIEAKLDHGIGEGIEEGIEAAPAAE